MVYLTGDTHFYHSNIITHCHRPFSDVDNMHEILIDNWNKTVNRGDVIYHLGDFAFTRNRDAVKQLRKSLNGEIHLIKGNHDQFSDAFYRSIFNSVSNLKEIKYRNRTVVLCHYALRVWNKKHYNSYHFYAHSHGLLPPWGRSCDVGVDVRNYMPFSIEDALIEVKEQLNE